MVLASLRQVNATDGLSDCLSTGKHRKALSETLCPWTLPQHDSGNRSHRKWSSLSWLLPKRGKSSKAGVVAVGVHRSRPSNLLPLQPRQESSPKMGEMRGQRQTTFPGALMRIVGLERSNDVRERSIRPITRQWFDMTPPRNSLKV